MKKKIVSAMTLVLLLTSMVTLAFHVQPVKAQGTIYIRADGSIDPPTAPISSLDNITYTFTDSIYDEIVVERNNIVIDGNGYTLQGTGAYASKGIDLSSRSNITSKNTNIKDFSYGILLSESSNICITGNNITNNSWGGIGLWGASNNTISGNHITNNSGIGIMLAGLFGSSNNRVIGNVLVDDGLSVWNSYGNVVVDNLVNGKPLVYLEGVSDVVVEDAGQVILVNCNRIKVENLNLSNTYIGVQLWQTNNATISGNQITNNSYGIRLDDSSNYNSISGNNITANNEDGIRLTLGAHSKYNSIVGNYIINNRYGIESGAENSISGNTITNNSIGIFLDSSYYSIIVGNQITNNGYGIYIESSSNNSISGNNITNNHYGIQLYYSSSNNILPDNVVNDNFYGIHLYSSSNNTLVGNHIAGNEYGIELFESSNNSLAKNNLASNAHGIEIYRSSGSRVIENTFVNDGLSVDSSYGNIVENNTVNGSPLVYLESVSNHVVENAGQVILVNCINIQVESLELSNTTVGVELWATNNTKIVGNKITANSNTGIKLYFSANNSITRNNIAANSNYGIYFYESSNNNVSENDIAVNKGEGIRLQSSSNNAISGNNITANNGQGVQLDYSSGNKVSGNNIANNGYGVYLFASSGNSIFHNNFANNTVQAYTYGSSANMWDDGYPSGGNYWSDYSGIDLYEGPYQNVTGSDGIGDTPYIINGYNQDNYPLMNQWVPPTHDIAVTNVSTSKSGCLPMPNVGQNQTVRVNISVENQGDFTETFNVTAYATNLVSTYAIGQQTVTLTAHTSTSITIVWNTLGFARSNYTLSAVADIVLGEADTADNTKVDGVIWVNLIGDVNCDDYVGIDDTFTIASHFAQDPSHPDWNTNCDLNDDDYVGIDDIFTAASHFGEENP